MKKLLVERIANVKKSDGGYAVGHVYFEGKYVCDCIEDIDRGLSDELTLAQNKAKKVYGKTAIPVGTYKLTIKVVSPKFYQKAYYRNFCYGKLPRILNIKGFDGVLLHRGSDEYSSAGCIILGYNKVKGKVVNSQEAFEKLYNLLKSANDELSITITRKYNV